MRLLKKGFNKCWNIIKSLFAKIQTWAKAIWKIAYNVHFDPDAPSIAEMVAHATKEPKVDEDEAAMRAAIREAIKPENTMLSDKEKKDMKRFLESGFKLSDLGISVKGFGQHFKAGPAPAPAAS